MVGPSERYTHTNIVKNRDPICPGALISLSLPALRPYRRIYQALTYISGTTGIKQYTVTHTHSHMANTLELTTHSKHVHTKYRLKHARMQRKHTAATRTFSSPKDWKHPLHVSTIQIIKHAHTLQAEDLLLRETTQTRPRHATEHAQANTNCVCVCVCILTGRQSPADLSVNMDIWSVSVGRDRGRV